MNETRIIPFINTRTPFVRAFLAALIAAAVAGTVAVIVARKRRKDGKTPGESK